MVTQVLGKAIPCANDYYTQHKLHVCVRGVEVRVNIALLGIHMQSGCVVWWDVELTI